MLYFAGFVSAAALTFAADTAADAVLGKLRPQLVADISDLRGVACMESVERMRYAPRRPIVNPTCGELIAAAGATPRGAMVWHSRLRLDVTAGANEENFALTDAHNLERNDVGGILRAANAGSGEFSTFLRNLINGDGASFQARGVQQTSTDGLPLAFGFSVPEEKSHFLYAGSIRAGYKGSLYVVPQSGELKRLTLEAEDVGDACHVQYSPIIRRRAWEAAKPSCLRVPRWKCSTEMARTSQRDFLFRVPASNCGRPSRQLLPTLRNLCRPVYAFGFGFSHRSTPRPPPPAIP